MDQSSKDPVAGKYSPVYVGSAPENLSDPTTLTVDDLEDFRDALKLDQSSKDPVAGKYSPVYVGSAPENLSDPTTLTVDDLEDFRDALKLEEQVSSSGWEDSFLDDELVRIEDLLSVANIIGRQYSKDYLREKLSECKIDDSTLDFPKLLEKLEELSRDFDPCAHAMLQKAFKIIDKEKKGYVTVNEVKLKVRDIMPSIPSAEFDSLFEGAEKHGRIDIQEFLDLIQDL